MTEKNYNPNQKENKAMAKSAVAGKPEKVKKELISPEAAKTEEKKVEKPVVKATPKVKKEEAVVNSYSLHISTKKSADVCRFIKGKKVEQAIEELGQVARGKKAVPMRGEIPHRKGRMMSGGFPKKTAEEFIGALKGLLGNATANGIDDPVIVKAMANMAARPLGRFGRVKRKRTHLQLVAREKKLKIKKKKAGGKKK